MSRRAGYDFMIVQAVKWVGDIDGFLELIDQRRLPAELVKIQCRDVEQLYEAIKTLAVRGAPAIGVAAAYGLVIAIQKISSDDNLERGAYSAEAAAKAGLAVLAEASECLASARPTAVNLFWALDRVRHKAEEFISTAANVKLQLLREVILAEANAIYLEDVDMCRRIGINGEKFIWSPTGSFGDKRVPAS